MNELTWLNLKELLTEKNARISCNYKWLCADLDSVGDMVYTVYHKKPYSKGVKIVYEGTSFASAIDFVGQD